VTSSAAPTREQPQGAGGRTNIYIAFVPWVLFAVISRRDTLQAATVVALAAALAIAAPGVLNGRPKQLEIGAVVAFALFTAVAFVADPGTDDFLVRYARAIGAALLAGIALLSLATTPFSEQYARETVPERYWSSPRFEQVNRELTLMWAGVFATMVPSHVIAGAIDTQRASTLFNWVVPIVLIVWAVKRTERLSDNALEP
jgi:hypothetical protein